jgi:hypothetical protein
MLDRVPWRIAACGALFALAGALIGGGCAQGTVDFAASSSAGTGGASSGQGGAGVGGAGGSGGATVLPCMIDCAKIIKPSACQEAVCDELTKQCKLVALADETPCNDGLFCTVHDVCNAGVCEGGPANTCATTPPPCHEMQCDEDTKTCTAVPAQDGSFCTPDDKCQINGFCQFGSCVGQKNDCKFSQPPDKCHVMVCDPADGMCKPQPGNDLAPCDPDPGDLCTVGKTCSVGVCQGGAPKNCSALTVGCNIGYCDTADGLCKPKAVMDGDVCDDLDACTTGEKCSAGKCGMGAAVTQCKDNDGCCAPGCACGNDNDCCLYFKPGVLQNVAPATLVGWTQCYKDTYDVAMEFKITQILAQCSKNKLLMACKKGVATNFQLVAMGNRSDVLFDCGTSATCTHVANGVGWYYSNIHSWGFVNGNDAVQRNQCDVLGGGLRMCWHTVASAGGYRCGDNSGLNSDATWERYVFHAN